MPAPPQTLLQPDLPADLPVTFKKVPVPLVVLWSPEKPAPQKRRIVPPAPDKAAIAVVRPTLEAPIKEENLADIRISSTVFVTQTPAPPPSTTSPIVVHGPEESEEGSADDIETTREADTDRSAGGLFIGHPRS